MTRKNKALIAITIPIIIITILKYFYPITYNILIGYMIAITLMFKSSFISIWLASKLKVIAFIKGLTLVQGIILALKRWFIDNVITKWIKTNIISHITDSLKEVKEYYRVISWRVRIKNILIFIVPISLATWAMYIADILSHFALYAELKVLISSFFKTIWVLLAKFTSFFSIFTTWLTNSWLAPIFEVFALSYLLTAIERLLGENNPISRFFSNIGDLLNHLFMRIDIFSNKHIDPIVEKTVVNNSKKIGNKISSIIKNRKINDEFLYFDNFKNIILEGHIDSYHSFKDMQNIKDKKELYTIINKRTKDNIDIIAYVSRNSYGKLLNNQIDNTFYHDIFILKGIASNLHHGVKNHLDDKIDHTDFWVLNTSKYPTDIYSKDNNFYARTIYGNSVNLIKTNNHIDLKNDDIYFEYLETKSYPVAI